MKHKQLEGFISELKEQSRSEEKNIWKSIAQELEKPTRRRRIVNLFNLDKNTKENEIVIVPGKVLATGDITHKITIAAYSFSKSAVEKINKVNGVTLTIPELMKKNPKGSKVRIMG